jgi:transposase, IS5 family
MRGQAGFFDVDERLKRLSAKGDSLERLNRVIDFELFRADLERAVPRSGRAKGGRPALRSCADVQEAGAAGQSQPVGRA